MRSKNVLASCELSPVAGTRSDTDFLLARELILDVELEVSCPPRA